MAAAYWLRCWLSVLMKALNSSGSQFLANSRSTCTLLQASPVLLAIITSIVTPIIAMMTVSAMMTENNNNDNDTKKDIITTAWAVFPTCLAQSTADCSFCKHMWHYNE